MNKLSNVVWRWASVLCFLLFSSFLTLAQEGDTLIVSPDGPYSSIDAALADAQTGDTIEVHGGTYTYTDEPLLIDKSVLVIGIDDPVIDGDGKGTVVVITAPDALFQGFIVRNSGDVMHREDSGIVIQADNVTVAENRVEEVLFGIYFANANNGIARDNIVRGYDLDIAKRGDSIRVWFSSNVQLLGNDIGTTRDLLIWYADDITISNNNIHDSRYGLHFMYSSNATIVDNTFYGNHVGTYLMHSQGLAMHNNLLAYNYGPSGYGLALKDMDEVEANGNVFVGNRTGIYLDNSPSLYEGYNTFADNVFAYNDIGVLALPAVERNIFFRNVFLDNLQQASTRGPGDLMGNTWTYDGAGNYWSDYAGYDAGGDGIGDIAYRIEKLFDSLMDSYPTLRFFIYSPASQALDFAGSAFPSLRPRPKLIDEAPLLEYSLPPLALTSAKGISWPFLLVSLVALLAGFSALFGSLRTLRPHRRKHTSQPAQAGI